MGEEEAGVRAPAGPHWRGARCRGDEGVGRELVGRLSARSPTRPAASGCRAGHSATKQTGPDDLRPRRRRLYGRRLLLGGGGFVAARKSRSGSWSSIVAGLETLSLAVGRVWPEQDQPVKHR